MRDIYYHTSYAHDVFASDYINGHNEYLILLRQRLRACGYNLRANDNSPIKDCEWVFFDDSMSVQPYKGLLGCARKIRSQVLGRPLVRSVYQECLHAGIADKMVLILNEGPAVSSENWKEALHKEFRIILTWNDEYVDNRKFFKIFVPSTTRTPVVPMVPFERKKLLVNISANKRSRHPRELYSKRVNSIKYFEKNYPKEFYLYGIGWDRPRNLLQRFIPKTMREYESYRGEIKRKEEVLPFFRFSLCYENVDGVPGYITEKIFDSMRCNCVPIYWGASNISEYVDPRAYVDRRDFKNDGELATYISQMKPSEYDGYLSAILSFLASDKFSRFLGTNYVDTVFRVLGIEAVGSR